MRSLIYAAIQPLNDEPCLTNLMKLNFGFKWSKVSVIIDQYAPKSNVHHNN